MVDDVVVGSSVDDDRLPQLMELYRSTWWAKDRGVAEVAKMVAGSDLVVTLVRQSDDRLVGFARVLTDFTFIGLVLDVVVAPDVRGLRLGARLMDAIVGNPELAAVQSLELVCQPELEEFYARWGFSAQVGRSRLMRRTDESRLLHA